MDDLYAIGVDKNKCSMSFYSDFGGGEPELIDQRRGMYNNIRHYC